MRMSGSAASEVFLLYSRPWNVAWALAVVAAISVFVIGCGGATESGPGKLEACSVDLILREGCECNGSVFDPATEGVWICDGESLRRKDIDMPTAPTGEERCNGLDDDLDGSVDEDDVCAHMCTPEELESLVADIVFPTPSDNTTVGGTDPEFSSYTDLHPWCLAGTGAPANTLKVECGNVMEVDGAGLEAENLFVAPGGVIRVTEPAAIDVAETLLLCPGGVIQAGGEGSSAAGGQSAVDLTIRAKRFYHHGSVLAVGGSTAQVLDTVAAGNGADVTIEAERWLFTGLVDTSAADHPDGYGTTLDAGSAGSIFIRVTLESFYSGTLRANGGSGGSQLGCGDGGYASDGGTIDITAPVCCHAGAIEGRGGGGGSGGAGEDDFEPSSELQQGEYTALCDGEDIFSVDLTAGSVVRLEFLPDPGEDLDLEVTRLDGEFTGRSEGVDGDEQVQVPESGSYQVKVYAFGPIKSTGVYELMVE